MSPEGEYARWRRSIAPYADWIHAHSPSEFKLWLKELGNGSPEQREGRVAEAVAWDWLHHRVDEIRPGLTSIGPSPDFRCKVRDTSFDVEVSNISRAVMTELTGMQDVALHSGSVGNPADRLHQAVRSKESKGRGSKDPYLVFVTTLHSNASIQLRSRFYAEALVTSTPFLQGRIDLTTGDSVGDMHEVVDFKRSVFTSSGTLTAARAHVSGVLVGPFGLYPDIQVLGVLHPVAAHPFDPRWLAETPFGRPVVWPPANHASGGHVEWTDGAP